MTEEERREMTRSNYAAQMKMLGYDESGNPLDSAKDETEGEKAMCGNGLERVIGSVEPPAIMFDLETLIQQVKGQHVEITVTYEPGRTEMSVQPWRPYTPTCPYAREEQEEIKHAD